MADFKPTPENVALAKAVVLEGWQERARERGSEGVRDASGSCKFASLFFRELFGGSIEGHYDHQYNVVAGQRFDLNEDCEDVAAMAADGDAHWHDPGFFGSPDHLKSMASCLPRVQQWVARFKERHQRLVATKKPQGASARM